MADLNEDISSDSESEPVPTTLTEQTGQNPVRSPEPEEEEEDGYTPLHSAIDSRDLHEIRLVLSSNGHPINSATRSSIKPLYTRSSTSATAPRLGHRNHPPSLLSWLRSKRASLRRRKASPLHYTSPLLSRGGKVKLLNLDAGRNAALVGIRTGDCPGWNINDCTAAYLEKVKWHEAVLNILVEAVS